MAKAKKTDRWEKDPGWIWGLEWTHIAIAVTVIGLGVGAFFIIRAVIYKRNHVRAMRASVEGMIVAVGPRSGSRITSLLVQPGEDVKAGQVIAWLDREALEAGVREAQAKLLAARAQVNISTADMERETTLTKGGLQETAAGLKSAVARLEQTGTHAQVAERRSHEEVEQAQTAIEQAEKNLARVSSGPKPQEIEYAKAALRAAEAKLNAARSDLKRKEKLLADGYVSTGQVEAAKAQADIAEAERDQAAQALDLLRTRPSKVDVEIAKLEVMHARQALAIVKAQASGTKQIRQEEEERTHDVERAKALVTGAGAGRSQVEMARRQVAAALAQVQIADAGLRTAESALAEAEVKSPIAGTVVDVLVHPGEVIGPGQPVALVVSKQKFWIEAGIPETQVRKVGVGQPAVIEIHAYPKLKLKGRVVVVGRATLTRAKQSGAPSSEGTAPGFALAPEVPVRINFDYGKLRLSPGMSAKVEIDIHPN